MSEMFSENETTFIRHWKRLWGKTPGDWSIPQIKEGISSFLDWREWLSYKSTSLELVIQCLNVWKDNEFPPPLHKVRREYNRRSRRGPDEARQLSNHSCRCAGSGVLCVVQERCDDGTARPVVDINRENRVDNAFVNTIPCYCQAGERLNTDLYHLPGKLLEKLQRIAFDSRMEAVDWIARHKLVDRFGENETDRSSSGYKTRPESGTQTGV